MRSCLWNGVVDEGLGDRLRGCGWTIGFVDGCGVQIEANRLKDIFF